MTDSGATKQVAVIGAGMAGLTCADRLHRGGLSVTVFEKSRGPGGRLSTRRGDDGVSYDHGAQYFTAHSPDFISAVLEWSRAGWVRAWDVTPAVIDASEGPSRRDPEGSSHESVRMVGVPTMNTPLKMLSLGIDCRFSTRVGTIQPPESSGKVRLVDESDRSLGDFDRVVVAAPAPQSAELLKAGWPTLAARIGTARLAPCWAVMAQYRNRIRAPFDCAFVNGGPLAWVARNSAKPSRAGTETWTLHASPDWSRIHLEDSPETVLSYLLAAFGEAVPASREQQPTSAAAHRWRYSLVERAVGEPCLADGPIVACGDWCLGSRVEDAWTSGVAAAAAVQRRLE